MASSEEAISGESQKPIFAEIYQLVSVLNAKCKVLLKIQ